MFNNHWINAQLWLEATNIFFNNANAGAAGMVIFVMRKSVEEQ